MTTKKKISELTKDLSPERRERIEMTKAFLRRKIDWAGCSLMLFYEMAAFLRMLVDRERMPDAATRHAKALLRRFEEAHR